MEYKIGYKAYDRGLVNQFGEKYEVGKEYTLDNDLVWQKNGFHFSSNLEDVFRYYTSTSNSVDVCVIEAYGDIETRYDEVYDYEVHYSNKIKIIRVLSREEIIEYAKQLSEDRLCRFIMGVQLTEDEIAYLSEGRSEKVQRYVDYYQLGDKNAFRR